MKKSLFRKLVKAETISDVIKLAQENCAIDGNDDEKEYYINHLQDHAFRVFMRTKDQKFALLVSRRIACRIMGGTDKQWMSIKS